MHPPLCEGEDERLAALRALEILDTPPEDRFDHVTAVVARLFNVPIAAVALVDVDREWFKSIQGLDLRQIPRQDSFCAYAILGDDVMVVPDARLDPRFVKNRFVVGEPYVRFYAGVPLRTPEGHPLGALSIADDKPRRFNRLDRQTLRKMATMVEDELLLRRTANALSGTTGHCRQPAFPARLSEVATGEADPQPTRPSSAGPPPPPPEGAAHRAPEKSLAHVSPGDRFLHLTEQANDAIFLYDVTGRFVDVNAAACRMFGYTKPELLSLNVADLEVGFDLARGRRRWQKMAPGESMTGESLNRRKDGSAFWAESRTNAVAAPEGRHLLTLVRDVTERRQAETLLLMRARQQKAVARLGVQALQGGDIQALLDEAVQAVGSTLEIEICRVLEHLPESGEIVTRAGLHIPREEIGAVAATDETEYITGYVLHTGESIIVKDLLHDPRFQPTPWLKASGAVSGLHVLIAEHGNQAPPYGLLAAYTREERVFTEDDVSFVQSVANVLAAAVARQQGEAALRAVEARYQRIAVHTPGVVYQYLLRPDGTLEIPFISEGCRKVFGKEPEELRAHPLLAIEAVHPDDREEFTRAIYEAKKTLIPLRQQCRLLLPDGEVRWVRFDSRPEKLPDGGVICDGIIVDVTEEEARKEAVRQSEKRFRLANLHAPFPIMLHASDGEVLLVNDAWTHITGYLAEQLPTLDSWLELAYSSEETRQEIRRFRDEVWATVGVVKAPNRRIRCAGGEERVWDFRWANLDRLPDGRWLHILTAIDVTEQREYEAKLRQAKEEAERANAAKSVFLSRMSHELRTPLNAILGFGQVLELGNLDGDDRQSVEQILKGGRHLLGLVDEVLDLARVESGELDLQLAPLSFHKLAKECIGLVARTAQARGVVCKVESRAQEERRLLADEQRLRQVLLNLLSNAIKYNREGGQVKLSCEWKRGQCARLKVADSGTGITPEDLARLFVPFERLGQEFGEVEGTGLGLVVSKNLVEAMGGRMGVESQPGRGSTFWIELPMAESAGSVSTEPPPATAPSSHGAPAEATLLYIEDNPSNVQVVKMVCGRLRPHWRLLAAHDGQQGLAKALEHRPDVILLDLQLPGMNGDAVLTELRAREETHGIPVLLLSADAMAHSRERLLALGATDYLPKPFNINDLLEKIDAVLETAHVGQALVV